MKINAHEKSYRSDSIALSLINDLKYSTKELNLTNSNLYYDFPIFKDVDGDMIISQILLVSQFHGVILISASADLNDHLSQESPFVSNAIQLHSIVFSRLLRNKQLRKSAQVLKFPIASFFFAPQIQTLTEIEDIPIVRNFASLHDFLNQNKVHRLDDNLYLELISTIEGAKGIIKPKDRGSVISTQKKGFVASEVEKEINSFDEYQKQAFLSDIKGPERIRGLAGSGKTIILALKAAMTHLRYPDANIVYTFYTKSLYQYIKRLITRFYRQYDDNDPDWNKLKILHAWGGNSNPGIYYEAALKHNVQSYSFSEASSFSKREPFAYICSKLLESVEVKPMYDFIFIDEGQDFPTSFLKLCLRLADNGKIVWAYDELQTIFQVKAPSITEVLEGSPYLDFPEDIILYKCYRNPREILVAAHALGFGVYSKRIVQMIESPEYWSDIGYKIIRGKLTQGEQVIIERPKEFSLETVSKYFNKSEIIKFQECKDFAEELYITVKNIEKDIQDGLRPDDILVVVVDDRSASNYLMSIQKLLSQSKIKSNNIHSDKYNLKDFVMDGHVTLSTVHKAKGNEAYSVHIVGIDALYISPSIRERNLMFTAMTRAKGWVSLTGIGINAKQWVLELEKAVKYLPNLEFTYPDKKQISIMKRDIKEKAIRKTRQVKMLDELLQDMSPEEIKLFLEQRQIKKKKP